MAMRLLPGRFLQHVSCNRFLRSQIIPNEPTCQSAAFSNMTLKRYTRLTRGIQTQAEAFIQGSRFSENPEGHNSNAKPLSDLKAETLKVNSELSAKSSTMSSLKKSSQHDLAMVFTCKVCETRSVKTCCRDSYENGVVVVRCGGCNNFHLMADRIGMFGDPESVEDLLAARGDDVKKGSVDSLNLTLEDLAGRKLGFA